MEWELSKENVRPLKEGRNIEKLNASLKTRVEGPRTSKLSEEHRKMVEAIDTYDGDDPLQPWILCIKWVKEAYPSEGCQSRLLQLLELCVRTFSKDLYYSDDIRYLKVWMDYADRCTNPRDIYTFLQDNNIGQQHALFYEQCGRCWEQQQRFVRARDIYDLGIARKAQPLESLKRAYKRFLQRASTQNLEAEAQSGPPGQPSRMFGSQAAGPNKGLPSQPARKGNAFKLERGMPLQFSVYADAKGDSNPTCRGLQGSKFFSESERNKENIQVASKWAGAKVGGSTGTIVAPEFKVEVFKDDDESSKKKEETIPKTRVPASRALRLDDINSSSREEDKLKQNPLVYFQEDDFLI